MIDRFFYVPPESFPNSGQIIFPVDEAKHVVKVLRLRAGAVVTVVDGQGLGAKVEIERADRHGVCGRILSVEENIGEPSRKLTIGLALLQAAETIQPCFSRKQSNLG